MKRQLNTRSIKIFNRKTLFIGFLLLMVLLFFIFNRELFNLILAGDIEAIRSTLAGKLPYAYLFMLFIMIAQNSFTVVPLLLVITVNITLFGVVNGFLWSWITSLVGGAIVFLCVRYIFQDWLLGRFHSSALAKVEEKGFIYVLQGRVIPFVPTSLINILAGISSIRFRSFFFATTIGNFFYFFVLTLIPAGLLSANFNEYEMGMFLFLVVTILFALKKIYDKKKKKNTEQPLDVAAGQQLDE
jgi:uncharacterized membrane protein YdjX (TVP38/TMEM64 family)